MTEQLLTMIGERFPLTGRDTADFSTLKANGMTFTVRAFDAAGLGHVSVMNATGFFGWMNMDTLIVNPTARDLPLFSYDRVHAMGNDTLILELYDTLLGETDLTGIARIKNAYADLPEHDLGTHWYDNIKLAESTAKKGKRPQKAAFDKLTASYLSAYLAADAAACEPDEKRKKAAVYVEGLLTHGGPSTDVFKKALGDNTTAYLFRSVLFGIKA